MRTGGPKVCLCHTLTFFIPFVHDSTQRARFQVKDTSTTIPQRHFISHGAGPVVMGIDETWGYHVPGGVDGLLAGDLRLGDGGDPAIPDAATLATASYIVSGSMTRPLRITTSYSSLIILPPFWSETLLVAQNLPDSSSAFQHASWLDLLPGCLHSVRTTFRPRPHWPARKRSLFCRNGTKILLELAFLVCALVGGDDLECPALLVATGYSGDLHDLA